ncbi:MAG: CHAT domain-containing protein [Reichenbachiella sp.]|uniref:CHAT domain-containing protein n=1 Tax=Reichenbachiella sp. TaxID=2184521 RepID=UPI00329959E1
MDSVRYFEDYNKGFALYRAGQYDSSVYYLCKSDTLALASGYTQGHYKSIFGMASVLIAKAQYDSATALYNGAIKELSVDNEFPDIIATANFGKGLIAYRNLRFDEAIQQYREVKKFRESFYGENHVETGKLYANLGMTFELIDLFDSSIYYQKKSMEVFADLLGNDHQFVGRMKHNLSIVYNLSGEQETALSLIKDAIEIREKIFGANHIQVALSYRQLGTIYDEMGLWKEARNVYLKAINIQETIALSEENAELGNLYAQLALNHAVNKDTLLALQYIKKAQDRLKLAVGMEHALYTLSLENYAEILYELGDYERSVEQFEGVQKNYELFGFNYQSILIGSHLKEGKALFKLRKYDQALASFDTALNMLKMSNDDFVDLKTFSSPLFALKILKEKTKLHLSTKNYAKANETVAVAFEILQQVRGIIQLRQDVAVTNQLWSDFNLLAVDINYQLYEEDDNEEYLNNIFISMNRNRASLIKSRQVDKISRRKFNIPDSLHLKEYSLLSRLSSLQSDLGAESDLQSSNAEISDLMFQIENIQETYANDYPEYFASKQQLSSVPLDEYRGNLKEDEVSIHYSFGDSVYYIIGVSKNETLIHRSFQNIGHDIDQFRKKLTTREDSIDYLAESLFGYLVKPMEHLISAKNNLTFYSSDKLNYIPLGLLQEDNGDYLLTKYQINYGVSPDLNLSQNQNFSGFSKNELLSFAPEFISTETSPMTDIVRNELSQLPGAKKEIEAINQFFRGAAFIGLDATESNFSKRASGYEIIHLATHAIVDDEDPDRSRLIFNLSNDSINDGYLYAAEIYDLDLNAKLVTLSACNTGFGQIKKGEGVMSLSRAFAYAEVPATVVSLWPASDKSTPELMKYFYQNLKDGQRKSVALNNARKQYLATATGKARHPFYWGGFVVIGDDSPITNENSYVAMILSLMFLLTAVPIVLVIKNKYLSID